MEQILSFLYKIISDVVNLMKDFEIYKGISLFAFIIALTVISIVITYLVNVAKSPRVTTTTAERARKERAAKK